MSQIIFSSTIVVYKADLKGPVLPWFWLAGEYNDKKVGLFQHRELKMPDYTDFILKMSTASTLKMLLWTQACYLVNQCTGPMLMYIL